MPQTTPSIPRSVLDHYNQRYQNATYRAFSEALDSIGLAQPMSVTATFKHTALNLLTDSALERSGAGFYAGQERRLLALIEPLGQHIAALVTAHLIQFGPPPDESALTEEGHVRADLHRAGIG